MVFYFEQPCHNNIFNKSANISRTMPVVMTLFSSIRLSPAETRQRL